MDTNNYISILGHNFSGRSYYAKHLCSEYNTAQDSSAIYIGEIPSNFISGILPIVEDEINLHKSNASQITKQSVEELFLAFDFKRLNNNNPFSLSGGEQTILVILCALLLEPKILVIDTTIEQINRVWRIPLLNTFTKEKFPNTQIILIDNRINEYKISTKSVNDWSKGLAKENYEFEFHNPKVISLRNSIQQKTKLEFQNLSFSYKKNKEIFRNLNLKLTSGNIYHLEGENGTGKSTFAKLLTGLLKLKKGIVLLDGEKINPYKNPSSISSYSFQSPDEQLFSKTVSKEILASKKKEPIQYTRRRSDILKMFGLIDIENIHPAELPFVIRKRISLASTLAIDRPWYIIDEPTLGQDDNYLLFLIEVLEQLKINGKGIILISHSEQFISMINHIKLRIKNKSISFV